MPSKGAIEVKLRHGGFKGLARELLIEADKAVLTTALILEGDAKRNISGDQLVDTGRLRASLHTEHKSRSSKPEDDLGVPVRPLEALVGSNVEYAAAQEFGATIPVTAKARRFFWYMHREGFQHEKKTPRNTPDFWRNMALMKKSTIRLQAHLYLTRAFNRNRGKLERRLADLLGKKLR